METHSINDHDTLGILATEGWIKAVWERACRYDLKLNLDYLVQQAPRAGNISLLEIFLAKEVKERDLLSLPQCRISHQAMYLSCIATAEGMHLDKTYNLLRPTARQRTHLRMALRTGGTNQKRLETLERLLERILQLASRTPIQTRYMGEARTQNLALAAG
jgi:hypothetical protein